MQSDQQVCLKRPLKSSRQSSEFQLKCDTLSYFGPSFLQFGITVRPLCVRVIPFKFIQPKVIQPQNSNSVYITRIYGFKSRLLGTRAGSGLSSSPQYLMNTFRAGEGKSGPGVRIYRSLKFTQVNREIQQMFFKCCRYFTH